MAAALDQLDDSELARRIVGTRAGTTDAEEAELYRRFAPRVRLFGRRHLRDDAASDDLAQDVLVLTIEKLRAGEVHDLADIGSFILGTSRLMAQTERRTTSRREALLARFAPSIGSEPKKADLDTAKVAECMDHLGDRDRLVVMLSFYAERDTSVIAAELGATTGAVRVMRHRALAHLRDCIQGTARGTLRADRAIAAD